MGSALARWGAEAPLPPSSPPPPAGRARDQQHNAPSPFSRASQHKAAARSFSQLSTTQRKARRNSAATLPFPRGAGPCLGLAVARSGKKGAQGRTLETQWCCKRGRAEGAGPKGRRPLISGQISGQSREGRGGGRERERGKQSGRVLLPPAKPRWFQSKSSPPNHERIPSRTDPLPLYPKAGCISGQHHPHSERGSSKALLNKRRSVQRERDPLLLLPPQHYPPSPAQRRRPASAAGCVPRLVRPPPPSALRPPPGPGARPMPSMQPARGPRSPGGSCRGEPGEGLQPPPPYLQAGGGRRRALLGDPRL